MNNLTNSSRNGTSYDFPVELYSEIWKMVCYSLVYGLISSVALIGNVMVFMVMYMNRTMHTATNVLLLNLSLSDMLFIVCSVPGLLAEEICNGRWVFGVAMAKVTNLFTILSGASSVFTLIAIALERYFAVVHPIKQRVRKKKGTVVKALIIVWVCSITLSIAQTIYTSLDSFVVAIIKDGVITEERQKVYYMTSTMSKETSKAYTLTIFVVLNVIPITVLTCFYARIVWKLWNPDRQLNQGHAGANNQGKPKNFVTRTRRRTTIMLIVVLVAFFVCMFPYNLFTVLIANLGRERFDQVTLQWSNSILRILVILNSATNPIIYNFLSEKFRTGFRNIFLGRWRVPVRVAATPDGETVLA